MSFDAPEPSEHKRTGHNWFDLFISICALVTSGLSMYVAYNNDQSLERLVHANSWPFLQVSSGNSDDDGTPDLAFQVKNAGTGPARIYSFEYLVDGKPVADINPVARIAEACCAPDLRTTTAHANPDLPFENLGLIRTVPVAPGVLAANDTIVALSWPRTAQNAALWQAIDQARQRGAFADAPRGAAITARACYCSVFDECWIAQTNALPQPLHGMCPMPHAHQSGLPGIH